MKAVTDTAFALFDTAIGRCALLWRGGLLIGAALPESSDERMRSQLAARFPDAHEAEPTAAIAAVIERVTRLLKGEAVDFADVPLALDDAAPFEREVYRITRAIPCGEVRTYGEIAREIGQAGAARAVGAALGRNPIPIIVPCHRVLAASGRSGGFSAPGGTETKFRILEIERARRSDAPELFEHLPLSVRPKRS